MAHIGVESFGACHAQKHRAQNQKAGSPMREQIREAVNRIECSKHQRMLHNSRNPHRRDHDEPDKHHRAKEVTDRCRSPGLYRKQHEQDRDGDRNNIGLQCGSCHVKALQRGQHRNRRSNRSIAVDQRRTEQADRHDGRPLLFLHSQQGHQGQDATLAIIVDAHRKRDIFHGGDNEESPEH